MPSITKRAQFSPFRQKLSDLIDQNLTDAELQEKISEEIAKVVKEQHGYRPAPFLLPN